VCERERGGDLPGALDDFNVIRLSASSVHRFTQATQLSLCHLLSLVELSLVSTV